MSTFLLLCQCDSIVTTACGMTSPVIQKTYEAETSYNDVKIVGIICVAVVFVSLIAAWTVLAWKRKEIKACEDERKLKKDKEHFPFYCVFPEQGGFLTGPGFSLGETVCLQENEPICISALAKPLQPSCFILSGAVSNCFSTVAYWTPILGGAHLPM